MVATAALSTSPLPTETWFQPRTHATGSAEAMDPVSEVTTSISVASGASIATTRHLAALGDTLERTASDTTG
jgi:hypothetical protein